MIAPMTAVEARSKTTSVLPRRAELQKRINELDAALLEHHKKAVAQQNAWRDEEAAILRQRNAALKELSEL